MEREKLKGHLDLLLLSVLAAGPAHGYAVITALRERSEGAFDLGEGTVYPALHRLEAAGLGHARELFPGAPFPAAQHRSRVSPVKATGQIVGDEYLVIQVLDALSAAPAPRPHAIDSETGRGLGIVSLLSDRWGFYHPADRGKLVWAALVTGAASSAP